MRRLDRRTVLRGVLGAAAVSIGLPPLEAFMNDSGSAYAQASGFPKRFGFWFFGNGCHADKWVPAGEGPDWEPSVELAPLAALKERITVVSGLKVYTPNSVPHGSGPAGILTGRRLGVVGGNFSDSSFASATLDQLIANEIGGDTLYRSLEVSVERIDQSLSYTGPGQMLPPENDPHALFQRLFGAGFTEPGDTPIVDPKLGLRRSVLDAIGEDAVALKKRLGQADRARVDQHFENIRALEKKLARLEEDPPNLAACHRPAEPLVEYPDEGGVPQMSARSRAMSDLMAMALACDQTRVFSVMFSRPVSDVLYPGAPAGHHQLTHDELGEQPEVQGIIQQIVEELAYFIGALDAVEEGDGTLLDHSIVLGMSDCSYGKSHAIDDYPLLLAGSGGGVLKTGIHYHSPAAENASKLGFSLMRAMDVTVSEFGADEGLVTEGLDDLFV
jgi:hypothetical protein